MPVEKQPDHGPCPDCGEDVDFCDCPQGARAVTALSDLARIREELITLNGLAERAVLAFERLAPHLSIDARVDITQRQYTKEQIATWLEAQAEEQLKRKGSGSYGEYMARLIRGLAHTICHEPLCIDAILAERKEANNDGTRG